MKEESKTSLIEILDSLDHDSLYHQPLKVFEGWSRKDDTHCMKRKDVLALLAGLGSNRPILITGEPGCGKSSMAVAYASLLGFDFIGEMIKPDQNYDSLLWNIDYVERFAKAQLSFDDEKKQKELLELKNFRNEGPVWRAFENVKSKGTVLLLDEIDKSELTLVNGLLDVLGEGRFIGPEKEVITNPQKFPLVVVMTSNGDRPMPAPVIRRCVLHDMQSPSDKQEFAQHCELIGKAKFPTLAKKSVLADAARVIAEDRDPNATVRSGVSEYIDLVTAWHNVASSKNEKKADALLSELKNFFIKRER